MPASSEDDSLFRVLEALPREGPPEFSVELLLRKLLWRRVRFGLLGAAVAAPLAALATGNEHFVPVLGAVAVLVVFLHRANIARLLAGTEPRIGGKAS